MRWRRHDAERRRELAYELADGDPDMAATFLALGIVLHDAYIDLQEGIGNHRGDTSELTLVNLARAWDGLDGEHDVGVLRDAIAVVHFRAEALR
jgi:hypothetical protein